MEEKQNTLCKHSCRRCHSRRNRKTLKFAVKRTPRVFDFGSKTSLGSGSSSDDFRTRAKVSVVVSYQRPWRCPERNLQPTLDLHVEKHAYTEMITPWRKRTINVRYRSISKFKEDVSSELTDERNLTLIPTAEVYNHYKRNLRRLPIHFTALSPSFRSEAGSGPRHSWLIRSHQFNK